MKPVFKAPGIMLLILRYDETASNFAFKFNLRRCIEVASLDGWLDVLHSAMAGAYIRPHFSST
jgi:hypothetical protein